MAKQSDTELRKASVHLLYEEHMLCETAKLIASSTTNPVEKYVRLESFLLHARNLIVFLGWHKANHPEDMKATHYVPKWTPTSLIPIWAEDLYTSVSNAALHLSYARSGRDPLQTEWKVREIVEAIQKELNRFLDLVPKHLLDPRFQSAAETVFSQNDANYLTGRTGPTRP